MGEIPIDEARLSEEYKNEIYPNCNLQYLLLEDKYKSLVRSIKEKAIKIAYDYPNIENCEPWEQLYAISSTYEGTNLANDECHKLIDFLRQKLNISKEELCDIWTNIRKN